MWQQRAIPNISLKIRCKLRSCYAHDPSTAGMRGRSRIRRAPSVLLSISNYLVAMHQTAASRTSLLMHPEFQQNKLRTPSLKYHFASPRSLYSAPLEHLYKRGRFGDMVALLNRKTAGTLNFGKPASCSHIECVEDLVDLLRSVNINWIDHFYCPVREHVCGAPGSCVAFERSS